MLSVCVRVIVCSLGPLIADSGFRFWVTHACVWSAIGVDGASAPILSHAMLVIHSVQVGWCRALSRIAAVCA